MGHPELREHWSQVCGWKVFARISDEPALEPRPGIVLVHGLAVSTRYMMPLARELAPAWKVYAPDLPGYGRSESPRRSLSIQALAEVLHLWISSMRLRETILIGNSTGCQIAVEYMLRCRHRVQACVMLGPTMDAYARNTPAQIWRLLRDQFHEPPSRLITWVRADSNVDNLLYGARSRHAGKIRAGKSAHLGNARCEGRDRFSALGGDCCAFYAWRRTGSSVRCRTRAELQLAKSRWQ